MKVNRFLVITALVAVGGCANITPSQRHLQSVEQQSALALSIKRFLPDSLFPPSNVGMMVRSTRTGQIIYENNSKILFTPASNQKLITSLAALSSLGPYYRLNTSVYLDSLERYIYLRGGGDPLLSPEDLHDFADVVSGKIHQKTGWTICCDPSIFDSVCYGPGWMWDDESDPSGMCVSGLNVNGNTIDVCVEGGTTTGASPTIRFEPASSYIGMTGTVVAGDSNAQGPLVHRSVLPQINVVSVAGAIAPGTKQKYSLPVWKPELFAGTLLKEALHGR